MLRTTILPEKADSIRELHRLSDWVVTLDRNAGIEYFDSPRDNREIYDAYVIDCVPEREDLGCLQLITSTSNVEEVVQEQTVALRLRWQEWYGYESVYSAFRAVRRAKLARVLRFYADKAHRHGLSTERYQEIVAELDRMVERGADYAIQPAPDGDRGWVFCPEYAGPEPLEISPAGWGARIFLFGPGRFAGRRFPIRDGPQRRRRRRRQQRSSSGSSSSSSSSSRKHFRSRGVGGGGARGDPVLPQCVAGSGWGGPGLGRGHTGRRRRGPGRRRKRVRRDDDRPGQ